MRERAQAAVLQRDGAALAGKVVLFVQGSRFGSTAVFDAPYEDYSWMAYLAESEFDTFALDMTGYGFPGLSDWLRLRTAYSPALRPPPAARM